MDEENPAIPYMLLSEQLTCSDSNPYLTYETLIIRILKRLTEQHFRLSWTGVLDTIKNNHCVLDTQLHTMLQDMWKMRTKLASVEDQHCMERVMGRDHVKPSDMLKVACVLSKVLPEKTKLYTFFACDGFLGSDLKNYVDVFKNGDVMSIHFTAVRELYMQANIHDPTDMRRLLKQIFDGKQVDGSQIYLQVVGSTAMLEEIGKMRLQAREKWKKKTAEGKKSKRKVEEEIVVEM